MYQYPTPGKGYRSQLDVLGSILKVNMDVDLTYVDVPLNLRYNVDMGANKAYIAAGPYVALLLRWFEIIIML